MKVEEVIVIVQIVLEQIQVKELQLLLENRDQMIQTQVIEEAQEVEVVVQVEEMVEMSEVQEEY